ncbi:MAG: glucose-1-phosphate cytidylyltransferase [Candidatus Wallbacteria bacterium]|nr:glucose-1-phosphate cytidylyltransferase [Candidatus Wallbacteria bacterium]
MPVVILCGGKGTRIRDVSDLVPKPMVPIGGNPILWHIMKIYAHHGFNNFILCLGFKGWSIKEYFLNYRAVRQDVRVSLARGDTELLGTTILDDWEVTLAETGEETMTGGRLVRVRKYLENSDAFMMTYGDGVSNVDLRELLDFHLQHGKAATVTGVFPGGRFGEISAGPDGQVTEFDEKPPEGAGLVNGGFFVFDSKRIWNYLEGDSTLTFEREPMRRLAKDRQLMVWPHRGFWQPMDTMREYLLLNEQWNRGDAKWRVW